MPGAEQWTRKVSWYSSLENKCEYLKPFLRAFGVEEHLFPLRIFVALTSFLNRQVEKKKRKKK